MKIRESTWFLLRCAQWGTCTGTQSSWESHHSATGLVISTKAFYIAYVFMSLAKKDTGTSMFTCSECQATYVRIQFYYQRIVCRFVLYHPHWLRINMHQRWSVLYITCLSKQYFVGKHTVLSESLWDQTSKCSILSHSHLSALPWCASLPICIQASVWIALVVNFLDA